MARFQFRPILVSDSRDQEDYDSESVSLNVYRCVCNQVKFFELTSTLSNNQLLNLLFPHIPSYACPSLFIACSFHPSYPFVGYILIALDCTLS